MTAQEESDERWFRGIDEDERERESSVLEFEFEDIDRDGDYLAALETEVVELRKDRDRLDKLDKHRIAASSDDGYGNEQLDYYYWELRCQCYDIRNAIDTGDING